MEANKYRIISIGDIPDSKGGVYNPGVLKECDKRIVLVRHEKDYRFSNDVQATVFIGNIEDMKKGKYDDYHILRRKNFPDKCRIEDFRLFTYQDEVYASHTLVMTPKGIKEATIIKPVISKIDLKENVIEYFDWMELPIKMGRIEKNWLLWEWKGYLYCIYSIDPLVIFKLEGFSWRIIKNEENGIAHYIKNQMPGCGFISLSAITALNETLMLAFWHTIHDGVYKQGMFTIDMTTLDIVNLTEPILQGGSLEGYKPNCLYVSGLVINNDKLEVWAGEADSNTCMIEMEMADVHKLLAKYPFKKITPTKLLFRDFGLGDYICMSYALQGYLDKHKHQKVKLYVTKHFELSSVLKMKGVQICLWNGEQVDVDITSNLDDAEYKEKLKHSFKEWYANKIGSKPSVPNTDHIKLNDRYEGYIVVAPYAAWEDRTWNIKYWTLLTEILTLMGEKVLVIDPHTNRCSHLKGELHCERSIIDDFRAIKAAKCVISNESGIAHAAGLLGTPTLVLCGALTKDGDPQPEKVYDLTKNEWIYKKKLQEITVDDVIAKLKEMEIL